jgi:carboxylesterase
MPSSGRHLLFRGQDIFSLGGSPMPDEVCVLIHGVGGSPQELQPLADALAADGYAVVVPSLAPSPLGTSRARKDPGQATVTSWITQIVPAVEAAQAEGRRVHLIGFSLGALLSTLIAEQYRVASVVMLAPLLYYSGSNPLFQQIAILIKTTWPKTGAAQQALRDRLEKMGGSPLQTAKQMRRVVQMAKRALPRLHCPICVIHGERDDLAEPRGAEFIYNAVPAAVKEVHYVAGAGHMLLADEADVVNRLVLQFLASLHGGTFHNHPALSS